jgi:hypothetical protein
MADKKRNFRYNNTERMCCDVGYHQKSTGAVVKRFDAKNAAFQNHRAEYCGCLRVKPPDILLPFCSHDHQFIQTIANRIIELTPDGIIDRRVTYDEYLERKAAGTL